MEERRHVGQRIVSVQHEPNRHAAEALAEAYQSVLDVPLAELPCPKRMQTPVVKTTLSQPCLEIGT